MLLSCLYHFAPTTIQIVGNPGLEINGSPQGSQGETTQALRRKVSRRILVLPGTAEHRECYLVGAIYLVI